MKVCTNCHLSFPDSASHCTQCGAPLTTVADQPPVYSGDPLDHTAEFDPADISANKVFALIPYLMGWVGVIITLLASSSSPYAGFHVRQALRFKSPRCFRSCSLSSHFSGGSLPLLVKLLLLFSTLSASSVFAAAKQSKHLSFQASNF